MGLGPVMVCSLNGRGVNDARLKAGGALKENRKWPATCQTSSLALSLPSLLEQLQHVALAGSRLNPHVSDKLIHMSKTILANHVR